MLNKPQPLKAGDKVAIVSLSRGVLGEDFAAHQRKLGEERLRELGLTPVYMPNARKGIAYLDKHPEARAVDLKEAFLEPEIKGIIAAIGGNDTYRLLPYLMEDAEFKAVVAQQPKFFTGFSDTTDNHLMFYRLGMQTFYGTNFLNDLAELDTEMLPYTRRTWASFFKNPAATVIPASKTWYEERTDFSPAAVGHPRPSHPDSGYEVLRGQGLISGRLWGGCLDSLSDNLSGTSSERAEIIRRYQLMLTPDEARDMLLFIETSEECPTPAAYRAMLKRLDRAGILAAVRALLVGKPQNKRYYREYQQVLLDCTADYQTPILYNVNIGHAYPHTVLPYGALAQIDFDQPRLEVLEPYFA